MVGEREGVREGRRDGWMDGWVNERNAEATEPDRFSVHTGVMKTL